MTNRLVWYPKCVLRNTAFSLSLPIVAVLITVLAFLPQDAHATTTNLDGTECSTTLTETWFSSNSTCIIAHTVTINAGDELVIPSGTTLTIYNTGGQGITNSGTITNDNDNHNSK